MTKKSSATPPTITNRRARYDYELGDELVVGLTLTGPEVRAARDGHIQLKGAFVLLKDDELWLNNASFSLRLNQRGEAGARSVDTTPRKLLAHRREIIRLQASKQAGHSIVPLRLLTQGRYVKLVIAPGKGKKRYDKRQTLKRRDQERDARRMLQ